MAVLVFDFLPGGLKFKFRADINSVTAHAKALHISDAPVTFCRLRDVIAPRAVTLFALNVWKRNTFKHVGTASDLRLGGMTVQATRIKLEGS